MRNVDKILRLEWGTQKEGKLWEDIISESLGA